MTPEQLRKRTTLFAVEAVLLCDPLWERRSTWFLADQLCRASTSTASNYRVASRARSRREFISKIGIALEEADESAGILEILLLTRKAPADRVEPLLKESLEIVAILTASRTTSINRAREQQERERANRHRAGVTPKPNS
jgi:four helix bundle protein